MPTKTVTVRMPEKTVKALDRIAEFERRDRSFMLNEAAEMFVRYDEDFRESVRRGQRQVRAGLGIPHEEVMARFEALKQKPKMRKRAS